MPKLFNLARMTTATAGTGTITLGVAVSGYLTFAQAGVVDQNVVFYGVKDGANSECGYGTYTSTGTALTRNVVKSTNSNAAISLSGSAEVYITAIASDGGDLLPGFDHPLRGFDTPINVQINASVASSILTVSVAGNNGSTPSNTNPVLIPFRDATAANGDPVWRAVTGALSISTIVGATQGVAASTPFRLWLVAFDNAGTVALALWQSVSGMAGPVTGVDTLDETTPVSTTQMTSGATSASTFYTPNGTTLTTKSFRILGYMDFAGLTTPGTYTAVPSKIQLFGPGVNKPGTALRSFLAYANSNTVTTAGSFVAAVPSVSISPLAACNAIRVTGACNDLQANTNGVTSLAKLMRNGTTQFGSTAMSGQQSGGYVIASASVFGYDIPGTTSSTTYQVYISSGNTSGVATWGGSTVTPVAVIEALEIMV